MVNYITPAVEMWKRSDLPVFPETERQTGPTRIPLQLYNGN